MFILHVPTLFNFQLLQLHLFFFVHPQNTVFAYLIMRHFDSPPYGLDLYLSHLDLELLYAYFYPPKINPINYEKLT